MKHVLLAYYSHAGHTAALPPHCLKPLRPKASRCDVVSMMEAVREGVDWDKYDIVIVGSPIVYGVYNRLVWEFVSAYRDRLESMPNSFFNVTVVARSPTKPALKATATCRNS